MAPNDTREFNDSGHSSWFTSEVQLLQDQMALLQSALETSKHAVEDFHRRTTASLEASAQAYQQLFDNVPTGVYRMSPDGHIILANPALIRLLGFDNLDELACRKLTPPWRLATGTEPNHVIGFERTWRKKNGERISVRESCRAVRDDEARLLYFEGVVEDISGQKKAEIFEHDCRTLLELVARNEPLDRILVQLIRLVERQTPGGIAAIMLNRNDKLYPAAAPGLPSNFRTALTSGVRICADGPTACAVAAFRKRPIISEDISTDPAWQSLAAVATAEGLRSCWSLPICSGRGQVLGTIAVYRRLACSPPYAEMQVVETTSRLASVAIEHRQLCDDLERQALRDRLTGLPNRAMFEDRLASAIEEASISGRRLGLLWIDIDRFKEINDTLGHVVGDALIRQVSERLEPLVRAPSMLARTGGDEFAIMSCDTAGRDDAEELAGSIMAALQPPFHINGCEIFVTASTGISLYPDHGQTATELQQNADAAMYRVKNHGRDGYAFYENALGDGLRERLEVANSLRRALDRGELELHFQPQIDFDGKLRGLEALLRWQHPTKGTLYPGHFIGLAEETGLIVPIGAWVLQEACRCCVGWNRMRSEPLKVAVNVSALQFYFSDLLEVVRNALEQTGLEPCCLEIELTESLIMRDAAQSAVELQALRALGVTIAIDDFGTGYSSLSYLQRLPVDLLKIDRSFVEQIESHSALAVVEAITRLAHALGLRVIAEGIETQSQYTALQALGVDLAQGYLLGRPVPPSVIEGMLRHSSGHASLVH